MLKKILAISIVLVLVFQGFGWFIYFKTAQQQIRKEMKLLIKQGVPEDELHEFSFTEEQMLELDWKKSNEFRFEGEMYDIVNRTKKGDVHIFLCVNDKQESILFAQLDLMVAREFSNRTNDSNLPARIIKLFKTVYLTSESIILDRIEFSNMLLTHIELSVPSGHNGGIFRPPHQV